jgi:hypothetical protein
MIKSNLNLIDSIPAVRILFLKIFSQISICDPVKQVKMFDDCLRTVFEDDVSAEFAGYIFVQLSPFFLTLKLFRGYFFELLLINLFLLI